MAPLLASVDVGLLVGIVVPIGSLLAVIMTAILTSHYRRSQRDDMEATLKMEMIQRGMSAEEIERVLAARIGVESRHMRRHGQPQWQPQHQGAPPVGR
jgi:hypothetical protein